MQICANVFEFDKQILGDPQREETAAGYFREEQKKEVSFKNFLCIYICALSEQWQGRKHGIRLVDQEVLQHLHLPVKSCQALYPHHPFEAL